MKTITLTIGIFYLSLFTFGQSTKDTVALEYFHGVNLEKIPEPGIRMRFIQRCITLVDSVISIGHISFNHSIIGIIEDCLFQYKIVHDTLVAVVIKTKKKINAQQVIDQSTTQFGKPDIKSENSSVLYTWRFAVDKKTLVAVMQANKSLTKSIYTPKSISSAD